MKVGDIERTFRFKYLSLNESNIQGIDDSFMAIRLVPDGKQGMKQYVRKLESTEEDPGSSVIICPGLGEKLGIRNEFIPITILDVDSKSYKNGLSYQPLARIIWSWQLITQNDNKPFHLSLFAAARRLDASSNLLAQIHNALTVEPTGFRNKLDQAFFALSLAESFFVSVNRAVHILKGLSDEIDSITEFPQILESKIPAVREIRNAFEHINERAKGKGRKGLHPDATTIFNQSDLFQSRKVRCGSFSFDLWGEAPCMLMAARDLALQCGHRGYGTRSITEEDLALFPPRAFFE